jgi:hypothetical protein
LRFVIMIAKRKRQASTNCDPGFESVALLDRLPDCFLQILDPTAKIDDHSLRFAHASLLTASAAIAPTPSSAPHRVRATGCSQNLVELRVLGSQSTK